MLETFIDITDRKQAETRIKEQYILLQTLIDTIPSPIFYKDTSGKYLGCNKAFEASLGEPFEKIIGKTIYDFFPPEKAKLHDEKDAYLFEFKETQRYEAEIEHADLGVRHTLVQKAAFHNSAGDLAGIVGIMTDTSEIRNMERRLQQAQKLESIGQLAAGIAHEIHTPTQFIQGNIEFLDHALKDLAGLIEEYRKVVKNTSPETSAAQLLEKVNAEAEKIDLAYLFEEIPDAVAGALDGIERITRIVDSMRYFSHPGRQEASVVNVNEAIENAKTVSRNHWKYCAEISTKLDPDLPMIRAHAAEFNQVLLNLLTNASDAICELRGENPQEKGRIEIINRSDGDMIEIRISDNGAGIPEAVRSRIFDPFFTTKDIGKGTGQGLAIAYNVITEMHGGVLDFETEVGQGTTFIIKMPIKQGTNSEAASDE